jgi:hypothetical protein
MGELLHCGWHTCLLSKIAVSCYYGFMNIDYLKLAELTPGKGLTRDYSMP